MHFGRTIYVELFDDRLIARVVAGGNEVVDTSTNVEAYPPEDFIAAFGHARVIVANFNAAERLVTKMYREIYRTRGFIKPVVVMRVRHRFADTATSVEVRALLDVLQCAGARRAYLWFGPALSDAEVARRKFPAEGVVVADSDDLSPWIDLSLRRKA